MVTVPMGLAFAYASLPYTFPAHSCSTELHKINLPHLNVDKVAVGEKRP